MAEQKGQSLPRTQNYVVARYRNGSMIKGITYDFGPQKKGFHVVELEGENEKQGGKVHEVLFSELKAVFFVKSLEGRKGPPSLKGLLEKEEEEDSPGFLKVKVTFIDGETLVGTTYGFNPEREGFFVIPLEKNSNNLRIFVISGAIKNIETWR